MGSPHYGVERLTDHSLREIFYAIIKRLEESVLFGFKGKHLVVSRVAGTYLLPHKLGFVPRDTFITGLTVPSGTATAKFNYDLFTATDYSLTITSSVPSEIVTVRAIIGRMDEEGF